MLNLFVRARRSAGMRLPAALFSICLLLTICFPRPAYAAVPWPDEILIEADGGILMDADSGCVLYGKNLHERYFPASITKILTALIIIENCNLDDVITFSHDAVYNVERGSTNAGYDTGDQLTVRDALYAMLLKSANEVANALAEHCAGSVEAFADMMNEKARSLGCQDSHFANPSGLNNPDHYTTPYDYALIAQAAFKNQTFVEFDSTTYYTLPPNSAYKEPFTVYCGHKMLKQNSGQHYDGIIGGKTGYTSLAGNTLVTCAERDGMKLITVVLNGHSTHYTDTRALLDFGFANFRNERIGETETEFSRLENELDLTGTHASLLQLDESRTVTLPKDALLSDAEPSVSYEITEKDPPNSAARIQYLYDGRVIGTTWLKAAAEVSVDRPTEAGSGTTETENGEGLQSGLLHVLPVAGGVLLVLLLAVFVWLRLRARQEDAELSLAESMRHFQQDDRARGQEGIYNDSSASVHHFDSASGHRKSHLRRNGNGWFKRRG